MRFDSRQRWPSTDRVTSDAFVQNGLHRQGGFGIGVDDGDVGSGFDFASFATRGQANENLIALVVFF